MEARDRCLGGFGAPLLPKAIRLNVFAQHRTSLTPAGLGEEVPAPSACESVCVAWAHATHVTRKGVVDAHAD